ncbi:glutamyl-tRNA reductase [Urinicoccus massiliensis]|uniref:glutamyl-tRNA reductase n=1 Tax=Urinicoccus massiliensis TaxID=1723382 RepID=UPI00050FCE7A|nr:glutamyl-tRNA reductase [Urinicoccus massiliensis]KGF07978.1 hypothetical protein HMPREF1633_14465 [Tissierellia bacterium S5-A11]
MKFCVVGINHHVAPIEIREKVHFKETDIIEVTDALLDESILELVILSTCNRSEIYFLSNQPDQDVKRVADYLRDYFQLDLQDKDLIAKVGDQALHHLFYVAIGLDSMIIGEDQILGQVVDAHTTAMDLNSSQKILNKIFREAITFAKRVKTESTVSDRPVSIAYIGVKKMEELFDLSLSRCMIIGLGEMGSLALGYLIERGAEVVACNRTYENSIKMQQKYHELEILPFEDRLKGLVDVDILISATSSPHTIINSRDLLRRTKPLAIMDLSLPRDVDPAVASLEDVTLYDIDSLQEIGQHNLEENKRILDGYKPEIDQVIQELKHWISESKVDPIMKSLNQRCDEIADDTLRYIFRKTDLTHNEQLKVEKIVRSALKKVVREPLLSVRQMDESDRKEITISVLKEVFGA